MALPWLASPLSCFYSPCFWWFTESLSMVEETNDPEQRASAHWISLGHKILMSFGLPWCRKIINSKLFFLDAVLENQFLIMEKAQCIDRPQGPYGQGEGLCPPWKFLDKVVEPFSRGMCSERGIMRWIRESFCMEEPQTSIQPLCWVSNPGTLLGSLGLPS